MGPRPPGPWSAVCKRSPCPAFSLTHSPHRELPPAMACYGRNPRVGTCRPHTGTPSAGRYPGGGGGQQTPFLSLGFVGSWNLRSTNGRSLSQDPESKCGFDWLTRRQVLIVNSESKRARCPQPWNGRTRKALGARSVQLKTHLPPASTTPHLGSLHPTPPRQLVLSQAFATRFALFLCMEDSSPRSSVPPSATRPLQASAFLPQPPF